MDGLMVEWMKGYFVVFEYEDEKMHVTQIFDSSVTLRQHCSLFGPQEDQLYCLVNAVKYEQNNVSNLSCLHF